MYSTCMWLTFVHTPTRRLSSHIKTVSHAPSVFGVATPSLSRFIVEPLALLDNASTLKHDLSPSHTQQCKCALHTEWIIIPRHDAHRLRVSAFTCCPPVSGLHTCLFIFRTRTWICGLVGPEFSHSTVSTIPTPIPVSSAYIAPACGWALTISSSIRCHM